MESNLSTQAGFLFDIAISTPMVAMLSLALTFLGLAFAEDILTRYRWTDRNFRGEILLTSMGLVFVLGAQLAVLIHLLLIWGGGRFLHSRAETVANSAAWVFWSGITVFALLGLLDDRKGSHEISGLRGHFAALFKGTITTGAVKAIGGAITALVMASLLPAHRPNILPQSLWMLCDGALIALAANSINLLDRRPARALKGYFLGLLALLVAGSRDHAELVLPMSIGAAMYAPLDFRCRAMMGDVGSNALGAVLGMMMVLDTPAEARVGVTVVLLVFNLLSERISYSKFIEARPALRWLDRLGTPR